MLSDERMQEIMEDNNNRMLTMMGYIYAHTSMGHGFQMDCWKATLHKDVAFQLEGVLISTIVYDSVVLYPAGVFTCSCCGQSRQIDHQSHCFISHDSGIVCIHCKGDLSLRPLNSVLEFVTVKDLNNAEYIQFVDMRKDMQSIEAKEKELKEHMEAMNKRTDLEFVYVDNKKTVDLYHDMLAKRAVLRWKAFVQKKREWKMFRVLYNVVGMDLNAAFVLARQVRV